MASQNKITIPLLPVICILDKIGSLYAVQAYLHKRLIVDASITVTCKIFLNKLHLSELVATNVHYLV